MYINHKVLTRQGYIISKKKVDKKKLIAIKNELTVKPIVHPDYNVDVESFKIFRENKDSICVPRYYGESMFGNPSKIIPMDDYKTKLKFKGKIT